MTRISTLPDDGYLRKPAGCRLETTPLDCEIDAVRPRYAFVTLGTNDVGMDIAFGINPGSQIESRLGGVIKSLLKRGVVPVLSTIPPILSSDPERKPVLDAAVARTNAGIFRLSRSYRLPLINLWRALHGPAMINTGMSVDGLHLSVKGAGGRMVGVAPEPATFRDSVDFRSGALRFGANRRNLILLRTLARLDRITG